MTDDVDYAWAAGFWDGEGNVSVTFIGPHKRPRLVVQIAQVQKELLDRFQKIVEFGNVLGPYEPRTKNSQPYYVWRVEGVTHLESLYEKIGYYLSHPKRWQMNEALKIRKQWELWGRCQKGHRLSKSPKGHWRCAECQSEQGKKNATARWGSKESN